MKLRLKYIFLILSCMTYRVNGAEIDGRHGQILGYGEASPYLIVSNTADANIKAGIYKRSMSEVGKWVPVFLGQPLMSQYQIGVLKYLTSFHEYTGKFELLAVIDGKLVLINIDSSADDPGSYKVLGTDANPIVDPVTGQALQLPPIKSMDQLSTWHQFHGGIKKYSLLFSVKYPELPNNGGTYLISGSLETMLSQENGQNLNMYLSSDPLTPKVMASLIWQDKAFFVPRLHKAWTLTRPGDPSDLAGKKNALKSLTIDEAKAGAPFAIVGLQDMKPAMSQPVLTGVKSHEKIKIRQYWDLISNRNELEISPVDSLEGKSFKIPGEIGIGADGAPLIRTESSDDHFALVVVGNQLYLYSTNSLIRLDNPIFGMPGSIQDVGFSYKTIQMVNHPELAGHFKSTASNFLVLFFLSIKNSTGQGHTWLKAFDVKGSANVEPAASFSLAARFMETNELKERIVVDIPGGGRVYFDYENSAEDFNPNLKPSFGSLDTKPLLDTFRMITGKEMAIGFINPTRTIEISERILSFREYNDRGILNQYQKTGFYVKRNDSTEEHFIAGQPLTRGEDGTEYLWDQSYITMKEFGKVDLYLVAQKASPERGTKHDSLLLISVPNRGPVEVNKININPATNFVKIIAPDDLVASGQVVIAATNRGLKDVYYAVVNFSGGKSINVANLALSKSVHHSSDEIQNIQDLGGRFIFDKDGKAYIIESPVDIDILSNKFRLRKLEDESIWHPNRMENKNAKFPSLDERNGKILREDPFYAPWNVNKSNYKQSGSPVLEVMRAGSSRFRNELFSGLNDLFEKLADPSTTPQHKIIVIEKENVEYLTKLVLANFVHCRSDKLFCVNNSGLVFHFLQKAVVGEQGLFLEALENMRIGEGGKRHVLFATMTDLVKHDRAMVGDANKRFFIEPAVTEFEDEIGSVTASDVNELTMTHTISPSSLYMVATEGKKTPLVDFDKNMPLQVPTVIFVTREELNHIRSFPENAYGLLDHFDIEEIEAPSYEAQLSFLLEIFDYKAIEEIRYQFDSRDIDRQNGRISNSEMLMEESKEILRTVVSYLIQRINFLSSKEKLNTLSVLSSVRSAIISDLLAVEGRTRKKRLIDKRWVDLIISQIFNLPLNLNILPDEDPIKIALSDKFLDRIRREGKSQDPAVVQQIVKGLRAQTLPAASLRLPSSFLVQGGTGSGKTELFITLVKTLGMKMYNLGDPDLTSNSDAQAIIINFRRLSMSTDRENNLSVDEAIEHLNRFITSYHGHRGWILFDDVQFASPEVRGRMFSWLNKLTDPDGPGGRITVLNPSTREYHEMSPRNIVFWMIFNQTDELLRRQTSIEESAKKTLDHESSRVTDAFLARFGTKISMNHFSRDQMQSALSAQVVDHSRHSIESNGDIIVFSPRIFSAMSDFPNVDVRSLLSTSSLALDKAIEQIKSGVRIVFPKSSRNQVGHVNIAQYFERSLKVGDLNDLEARLRFFEMISSQFRTLVFKSLVDEIQNKLNKNMPHASNVFYRNTLEAFLDHMISNPFLPLSVYKLKSRDFGISLPYEIAAFTNLINSFDPNQEEPGNYFPTPDMFEQFGYQENEHQGTISRRDILVKYAKESSLLMQPLLDLFILGGSGDRGAFDVIDGSLNRDNEQIQKEMKNLGDQLHYLYTHFVSEFVSEDVQETMNGYDHPDFFEIATIFAYVLDRAISQHINLTSHTFQAEKVLKLISRDMTISSEEHIRDYLFGINGILRPLLMDEVAKHIRESSGLIHLRKNSKSTKVSSSRCEELLIRPRKA